MQEHEPDGRDDDAAAARFRRIFEDRARASPDAGAILGSPIVENAVREALRLCEARAPGWSGVAAALRDADIDRAETQLGTFLVRVAEAKGATDEARCYMAAQIGWAKATLVATRSIEDALYLYESAIELTPENLWLRADAAKLRIWAGDTAAARSAVAEMLPLAQTPDDLVTLLSDLGQTFEDRGDLDAALYHYRQAFRFVEAAARGGESDPAGAIDVAYASRDIARLLDRMDDRAGALEMRRAGLEALARIAAAGDPDILALHAGHLAEYAEALGADGAAEGAADRTRAAWTEAQAAVDRLPPQAPAAAALRARVERGIAEAGQTRS